MEVSSYSIMKQRTLRNLLAKLTVIILLFQLVSIGWINYLEYIAFFTLIIILLRSTKVEILSVLMFLLPSNQYINIKGTSVITTLVVVYCVKYFLIKKEGIQSSYVLLSILLIAYSLIFHEFSSIAVTVKTIMYLLFCMSTFNTNKKNIKQLFVFSIKFLSLGIIFTSIIAIIINPDMLLGRFSLTAEQSTNTLSMLAIFAVGNILMMIQSKNYQLKNRWFLFSFLLLLIGFLTRSRTFVVGIVLVIVWLISFMLYKNNEKGKVVKLLIVGAVLFGVVIIIYPDVIEVITSAIERVTNPRHGDLSGGRTEIWKFYINKIRNSEMILLFGTGKNMATNMPTNRDMLPHNLYIEQIHQFGLIGNSLLVLLFSSAVRKIYKVNKELKLSIYGSLPLALMISTSFFTHSFVGGADTIRFIIATVAIGLFSNKKGLYEKSNIKYI